MAYVGYWSGTMAIDILLSLNFHVVFYLMYFRFRQVKLNLIGDVPMNRQDAAMWSMVFSFFITRIAYWRSEWSCVVRRYAANRKKPAKYFLETIDAANLARIAYIGAGNNAPSLVLTQRFIHRRYAMRTEWGKIQNKFIIWLKILIWNCLMTQQVISSVLPIHEDIAYWFCFTVAETEIHKMKDDSQIKR